MPVERGYETQVQPRGPAGLPSAGAGSFGAQVGAGIEQLGDALKRHDDAVRDAHANEEQAAVAVGIEQDKAAQEADEAARKEVGHPEATPGAAGYREASQAKWKERTAARLATIKDPRVRQNAEIRLAAYGGDVAARTTAYEAASRWTNLKANADVYSDALDNRVIASTDPNALIDGVHDIEEWGAGLVGISPDQQAAIVHEKRNKLLINFAEAKAANGNPADIRALVASKLYASIDPDVIARVNRIADLRQSQLDLKIVRDKREADAKARANGDALIQDANRGVAVDPEALRAEAARVRNDDPARAGRFEAAAITAQTNKVYGNGNADPGMMTRRVTAIEATKGWQSNPALVAEHSALETLRDNARKETPEFAPLNFADPNAIRQRVVDSEGFARLHNGRRVVLGPDDVTRLSERAAAGPAGRAEVAEQLSRLPGGSAIIALDQVAPKDAALRQAISLPPRLRGELFRGEEARKANAALVPKSDVGARWGERAIALEGLPPQAVTAIRAAAENIYAARTRSTDFDQGLWDQVVNEVLDPSGKGGIGAHRNNPILLPDGMTQAELDRRWMNVPEMPNVVHRDGTRIARRELLDRYHLVTTGYDGKYHLADDQGRKALARNGSPALLDVRRLSAAIAPRRAVKAPTGPVYIAPPQRDLGVQVPVYVAPPRPKS